MNIKPLLLKGLLFALLISPGLGTFSSLKLRAEAGQKTEKQSPAQSQDSASEPASEADSRQNHEKPVEQKVKRYQGEPGTFIFYKADLKNVLLFFAKTYKLNMVLDPGIRGKVTIRLVNVPWDQALDLILRQHGLALVKEGSLLLPRKIKK